MDIESRFVKSSGQRIHVKVAGYGPLVLCCHGFPESWYSWRHQIPILVDAGYRVAAMDMRGYGQTSQPADCSEYRIDKLVNDCVDVIDGLGETDAVIIGHDWGAPVAWTTAWLHPGRIRGVAGLSVPFSGRGLTAFPGDPFGERRPSVVARELAGEGKLFYQEYFTHPEHLAEREAEEDLRSWMAGVMYSFSATPPVPDEIAGIDLMRLSYEEIVQTIRAVLCVAEGVGLRSLMQFPDGPLPWLTRNDLDFYIAEIERNGLTAPLNYYRNIDSSWELLGEYSGRRLDVPALFIGGDRDAATIWSREAVERASEVMKDFRGAVIVPHCGHWIQQEQPQATNDALLAFLEGL